MVRVTISGKTNVGSGEPFLRSLPVLFSAADLARDQRALDAQLRDIRHDQRDIYRDEQSYQRWR
jgi:hypothetical protein